MTVKDVLALHEEMKDHAVRASVDWDRLLRNIDKWSEGRIQLLLNFLKEVKEEEMVEILRVWHLPNMTEEMWANYDLFFEGNALAEQKQLAKAQKALRDKVRIYKEALKLLRKHERGTKKTETKEGAGSDSSGTN